MSPSYEGSLGGEAILTMCCNNRPGGDVLHSIMTFFNKFYSHDSRNLFLGPTRPGDISSENVGQAKMIYALIDMGDHYAAARLDVERRESSLGHSISRPVSMNELDELERLITPSESGWNRKNFVVVYDANVANSGIFAAAAIEQAVNVYAECPSSIDDMRIRYLRLVSGYTEVEYITLSTCLRWVGRTSLLLHVTNTSLVF
jgi:hypothetical protein